MRRSQCEPLESRIALSATAELPASLEELVTPLSEMHDDPHADHDMHSGGVMITPTAIHTHQEVIPRFAADPTITSVGSGSWTDPATWSLGRVPRAGDRVMIGEHHAVVYDSLSTASIDAIEVHGLLNFSTTANTRLLVANLTVMPVGELRIGTAEAPVSSGVTAELIIADQAIDLQVDPQQWGTALIGLGKVSIHGSEITQTWQRLTAEAKAGDQIIWLSESATNWRVGDTIVFPDTRQVPTTQTRAYANDEIAPEWETAEVRAVFGRVVILAEPLKFDHLGARNVDGDLELLPHVALLDRNVIVRSENPAGTRGHTVFTARADVDIAYARFSDLGRTDAFRDLDNTTFDEHGNVTHYGTNQIARYAVHFHHLMGPENPSNTGYQFQFVGNTVERSLKWAVDVHGTSFGLVERNVIYDAQGAGIVTEDGSEIGNFFVDNITIRIQGTHSDGKSGTEVGDYGRGGAGLWFRRGGNYIFGNVAVNNTYAGIVIDGYNAGAKPLPRFRGASLHDPEQTVDGTHTPSTVLWNNEVYGMTPIGLWGAYISGHNLTPTSSSTLITDLRVWHAHRFGVQVYHTANVTFNDYLFLGDLDAWSRNGTGPDGMELTEYENLNMAIRNSRIEGAFVGIRAPLNDSSLYGAGPPTRIEDSVLRNYVNIQVNVPRDGSSASNEFVVRNVKFEIVTVGPVTAGIASPANIKMLPSGNNINHVRPSKVYVYSYNQVPGDDFQVFYHEQAADYVLPQTDPALLGVRDHDVLGSPEADLTNAENWAKYGIAFAGAVAPPTAEASRPEIYGLVAPIQSTPTATKVALLTPWQFAVFRSDGFVRVRFAANGDLPAGSQIWFQLDDRAPVSPIIDGGFFGVDPGLHTIHAWIGDAEGNQLAGTTRSTHYFATTK